MKHLAGYFNSYPIIPAVRDIKNLEKAMRIKESVLIFLLTGSIFNLEEAMELAHKYDKILMVNIDLVKGIAHDKEGIRYLAEKDLCDGIISTKGYLIKEASNNDLMTIQRVFLLDSASLISAEKSFNSNNVDAVEILPGLAAPYFIERQNNSKHKYPVIAGGLIKSKSEVDDLKKQNIFAVSTSDHQLWKYN
ncbi:glycerol uptake operon antiterminator [Halanaerobium congolense]|uniref:Glycerol uptake operon antiterminator n=1 Tax=Halanaerobium congolense TaxID=54121 RepID=A0A1G6HKS7_9FIRM|nr:glycerol-3-phosphate responsive antiterminator [Halanaerobium congolense]OEG63136.1 MAG: glycerol-3-phosphate responsive antiterminator GlpP [Halanaerobium sp. MDAL1]PXV70005.1 glycerol uptake operon antiterminator [Halanaerobium congolense]TDP26972.1 glycerol uptake operon antiterminator [Halanaerobium congolense]TDS33119.1 glycerol uptake operon antiterminator [Halanaerobium congolense]TDX48202.1 glycerol uptake operon antiterminator [Halanaerobium congolense]